MVPEIKQRWVEALRSGEYKQGNGNLRNENNEFCCLGVLCNLVRPEAWDKVAKYGWTHGNSGGFLSTGMMTETGIGLEIMTTLTRMNDTGWSFAGIADFIEREL